MAHLLSLLVCLLLATPLCAKDLGDQGHTFSIQEENLLEHLQRKLSTLSPDGVIALQERIQQYYIERIEHPNPLKGLGEAKTYRCSSFDPTITVSVDILDHEGNVIVKKGTSVNPLDCCGLNGELLFLDGNKPSHIAWGLEQPSNAKWILVGGKPLALEEQINMPVFFDQGGFLTNKFGIEHVPAKASQNGSLIKIEEIPVNNP